MSTSAIIAALNPDGSITGIRCSADGDVPAAGVTLKDHSQDEGKARALMALGDIYVIGAETGAQVDYQRTSTVDKAKLNQCIAFHRDWNRKFEQSRNAPSIGELL